MDYKSLMGYGDKKKKPKPKQNKIVEELKQEIDTGYSLFDLFIL